MKKRQSSPIPASPPKKKRGRPPKGAQKKRWGDRGQYVEIQMLADTLTVPPTLIGKVIQKYRVPHYLGRKDERGYVKELKAKHAEWIKQLFQEQIAPAKISIPEPIYIALDEIAYFRGKDVSQILGEEIEAMVEEEFEDFRPSSFLARTTVFPNRPVQPLRKFLLLHLGANKTANVKIVPREVPIGVNYSRRKEILDATKGKLYLLDVAEYAIIRILRSALLQTREEEAIRKIEAEKKKIAREIARIAKMEENAEEKERRKAEKAAKKEAEKAAEKERKKAERIKKKAEKAAEKERQKAEARKRRAKAKAKKEKEAAKERERIKKAKARQKAKEKKEREKCLNQKPSKVKSSRDENMSVPKKQPKSEVSTE